MQLEESVVTSSYECSWSAQHLMSSSWPYISSISYIMAAFLLLVHLYTLKFSCIWLILNKQWNIQDGEEQMCYRSRPTECMIGLVVQHFGRRCDRLLIVATFKEFIAVTVARVCFSSKLLNANLICWDSLNGIEWFCCIIVIWLLCPTVWVHWLICEDAVNGCKQ